MRYDFEVIVVGGGHAGCEAAVAAATMGSTTLLITSDMNRVAQMSCNPAVGGIAKGQIVREIDALGGMMGIVADTTAVQFRMLNKSKGPAVWSPRVQSDRTLYIDEWRKIIDSTDNLSMFQDTVTDLIVEEDFEQGKYVTGVNTSLGFRFNARCVILTVGTFLNGLMHFGPVKIEGGRISEAASKGLTERLVELGFKAGRMKTGTPARIDGRTINFALTEPQSGDDIIIGDEEDLLSIVDSLSGGDAHGVKVERDFHKFSFLPDVGRRLMPRDCYIVHTSPEVHQILRDDLDNSPLYNGDIQSIGPRYCPSIETKIVTFADKESHQLFLEPEGETTMEFYINGFSSSLPWKTQVDALSQIPALKDVQFYRPGYAIEYDYFDSTQLAHDLQTKLIKGLYFAGQINGTTGYEEAAAQGLMAGINAALASRGKEPLILNRDQAYIGVLIDDLVTKGVDEPYRMFTSRAEYRILLRQDDADMRLTPIGYEIGLASDYRYDSMLSKKNQIDRLIKWCENFKVKSTPELNKVLKDVGSSELNAGIRLSELLKRPNINLDILADVVSAIKRELETIEPKRRKEIIEATEILIKYEGYIKREKDLAEKQLRLEYVKLPDKIDYSRLKALSTEARQKLDRIRPSTIGQASRIPGVSPADVQVLLLMLNR